MTLFYNFVLLFFVLTNVIVEWKNRALFSPFQDDLSEYLAGVRWYWLQDAGYIVLAFTLPAIGYALGGQWVEILFAIAAVALVLVVATKLLIVYVAPSPQIDHDLELVHLASAGLAFGALTVALIIHSWGQANITFAASFAAPLSAAAFNRFCPKRTALEEKAYTLFLLIAIFAAL